MTFAVHCALSLRKTDLKKQNACGWCSTNIGDIDACLARDAAAPPLSLNDLSVSFAVVESITSAWPYSGIEGEPYWSALTMSGLAYLPLLARRSPQRSDLSECADGARRNGCIFG